MTGTRQKLRFKKSSLQPWSFSPVLLVWPFGQEWANVFQVKSSRTAKPLSPSSHIRFSTLACVIREYLPRKIFYSTAGCSSCCLVLSKGIFPRSSYVRLRMNDNVHLQPKDNGQDKRSSSNTHFSMLAWWVRLCLLRQIVSKLMPFILLTVTCFQIADRGYGQHSKQYWTCGNSMVMVKNSKVTGSS